MILKTPLLIALLGCFGHAAAATQGPTVGAELPVVQVQANGFVDWVNSFRGRALAAGITSQTFGQAFNGAQYLPDSIRRDRNQANS